MIALVWGGTLNSSAANFRTAVKGAASGTLNLKSKKKQLEITEDNSNRRGGNKEHEDRNNKIRS